MDIQQAWLEHVYKSTALFTRRKPWNNPDYLLVMLKLKSHSFLASSAFLACELGSAILLSVKYFPLIPLTCGCNAI
jgi:hypothetical protein